MGALTPRGEAVQAGFNALAGADGSDELTIPAPDPGPASGEQTPVDEPEKEPAQTPDAAPAPAQTETAVDVVADERETRG